MRAWLESIAGPEYASAMIWTLGALILLLVVLVVIRVVRGLTFGTFVAGGRNRKTRLAVMDATAVDSHRRLVLVRRDDVEHLVLIGGPTDIVVEQNIRLQAPARKPAAPEPRPHAEEAHTRQSAESAQPPAAPAAPPPAAANAPAPKPAQPAGETPASLTSRIASALRQSSSESPQPKPAPTPAAAPKPAAITQPSAPPAPPALKPVVAAAAAPVAPPAPAPAAAPAPPPASADKINDLDDTLLKELEVTLGDRPEPKHASPAPESPPPAEKTEKPTGPESVEDEMARLLGQLSEQREK
ncbi:MAG: flagellar biosynthetic protein FliO [Rhizobiaceae bacterium]